MTGTVLDASVALSWCFPDEASPAMWQLLDMVQTQSAVVPGIWSLEVANILSSAERNHRLPEAKILEFLDLLDKLNIEVDPHTSSRAFREILQLSRTHSLSTYDAAYFELAMRLGIPLATKDKNLRKIASKLGVQVMPKSVSAR